MAVEDLIIYQKAFDFFIWQKSVVLHLAKVHKYSLGIQIESEALDFLKEIVTANMARERKAELIGRCMVSVEMLKVLFRAGYELNREGGVSIRQYGMAGEKLTELGDLCGGWFRRFQFADGSRNAGGRPYRGVSPEG
jgi:hypothetical protein